MVEGEKKQESAGNIQKGSFIIMDGVACRVNSVQTSKPGKHGHAKCRIEAVGLIDDKKRIEVMPGHASVDVPIITKKAAQVLSVNGNIANVMEAETFETFDLEIPEEVKGTIVEGGSVVYWQILDKKVMKQIR